MNYQKSLRQRFELRGTKEEISITRGRVHEIRCPTHFRSNIHSQIDTTRNHSLFMSTRLQAQGPLPPITLIKGKKRMLHCMPPPTTHMNKKNETSTKEGAWRSPSTLTG